ncbi:hypothetical protein D3C72_1283060 [compost metagenome]
MQQCSGAFDRQRAQGQAHGPELADVAGKRITGEETGQVQRRYVHVLPSGTLQQLAHPLAIGEGELSWCTRCSRWQHQLVCKGALGGGHERIFLRTAPGDEAQACAGSGGTVQVGEGGLRVLEEHHPEPRLDPVVARRCEGMALRIGHDEVDVAPDRSGTLAGEGEHRCGDVDAGAMRIGTRRGGGQRTGAGATADVQQFRDGSRQLVAQRIGHRLEQAVQQGLLRDPVLASRAVPERVLIERERIGHGLALRGECDHGGA